MRREREREKNVVKLRYSIMPKSITYRDTAYLKKTCYNRIILYNVKSVQTLTTIEVKRTNFADKKLKNHS